MNLPKPSNTTRFHSLNPNGFRIKDANGGDFREAADKAKALSLDVACYNEINLDTSNHSVLDKLHYVARQTTDHYRLQPSSSDIIADDQYKPGGTLTLVRDNLTSRVTSQGTDALGRWSYVTFLAKSSRVTVINIYQPGKNVPKDTNKRVVSQQQSQLRALNRQADTSAQVRSHYVHDLDRFLKKLRGKGHRFILMGDFNEIIGSSDDSMSKLCRKHNLVDCIHHFHGDPPRPFATWYDGEDIIDYALIDESLLSCVKACGYAPFKHYMDKADHRGFYIDFDTTTLFGSPTARLQAPKRRRLRSTVPKQVVTYFEAKFAYLEQHNFFTRLKHLESHPNDSLAERLDRQLVQASLYAEKQLPKHRDVPFSPDIANLRERLNIYRLIKDQFLHNVDLDDQIRKRIFDFSGDIVFPNDYDESLRLYQDASKALNAAERAELKEPERRDKFLREVADSHALHGNLTSAQYLKRLRLCEDLARTYAKCAKARGKVKTSGFSYIEVPQDPTANPKKTKAWRLVDTPKEIKKYLTERNQKHFGQAQGTPWTVPPLAEQVNFEASTQTSDLILEGDYTSSELDDITQLLIQHIKQVDDPTIDGTITHDEFKEKIQSWRESTSTSPSGVHLGHYRAYYAPHNLDPKTPEGQEFEQKRQAILDAQLFLINYAIRRGYSYSRWKKIVTMMIEKESGNYKIHRLRVIHMYEADYTLCVCVKWRQAVQQAAKNGHLNPAQRGGIPGRNAPDIVFCEEIEYELCRASRTTLGKFDNDATACYDRIPCCLANLVSRKFGMDKKMCIVTGRTLKEARYHLKTQLGVSEDFFSHCEAFPIHGTGQGSGNSPVYWAFISSVLFDCHASRANGAVFSTPDKSFQVTLYMLGFVDDTSNRTNDFFSDPQPSIQHLLDLMSHDAQLWQNLLHSSGGDLELPKCSFHHVRFKFSNTGRPHMVQGCFSPDLFVTTSQGNKVRIKQLCTNKSHKLLGCHKAPTGNSDSQYYSIKTKCDDYAKVIQSSCLTRLEAKVFYRHIYIPSVSYPLSTSHFTESDLNAIQSSANKAIFRHCGYWKGTPLPLLYGPSDLGGAEFDNLIDCQGVGQLQMILKHLRVPGLPGSLTTICLSWWQFVAGTSTPILEDHTSLPHLDAESFYFKSIRAYLLRVRGTVEVDQPHVPPLQRENDAYIMDLVLKSGKFNNTEICYINWIRLHLQVVTVSDLAQANGQFIDPHLKAGEFSSCSSKSKYVPCHQGRTMSYHCWRNWNDACAIFCKRNGELRQPLGKWLVPPADLRRDWPAYYHPSTQTLYRSLDQGYSIHLRCPGGHLLEPSGEALVLPPDSVPIDYDPRDTYIRNTLAYSKQVSLPAPPPVSSDFQCFTRTLPEWELDLFLGLWYRESPDLLARIASGDFIMASDGSAPEMASFGWVLATPDGQVLALCQGPVCGASPASFRAEAYGLLSCLRFVTRYLEFHNTAATSGYQHYTDSQSLLDRITTVQNQQLLTPDDSLDADWDVVNELLLIFNSMSYPPSLKYVKSHQDRTKKWCDLPIPARLNCEADQAARRFFWCSVDPNRDYSRVPRLPHNKVQLHLSTGTVTSTIKRPLVKASQGPALIQQMCNDNAWESTTPATVDWEAHGILCRNVSHPVTHLKFLHGILPVGVQTQWYHPRYDKLCPCCLQHKETQFHFYRCPAESKDKWRSAFIQTIKDTCQSLGIVKALIDIMIAGVSCFFNGDVENKSTCHLFPHIFPAQYRDLIKQQNAIGWLNFIRGRWSKEWAKLQHEETKKLLRNGKKTIKGNWIVKVSNAMWESFWVAWEERNQALHGTDFKTRHDAKNKLLKREASWLHSRAQHYPQELFSIPLEELLSKTNYQLHCWIKNWTPVMDRLDSSLEAVTVTDSDEDLGSVG